MAATLKDVAEHAGVSIATVSRVLNEPENEAEDYKVKLLKDIYQVGYSSHLVAKSLRTAGRDSSYFHVS